MDDSRAEAPPDAPGRRAVRFDPAFREAVESGWLTPAQAYARGKREIYAERIRVRDGLPEDVALAVADNRITLAEALGEAASMEPVDRVPMGASTKVWFGMLLIIMILAGWQWLAGGAEAPPVQSRSVADRIGVVTDTSGQVVRVIGRDPHQVLVTFCDEEPAARLEAVGVMPSNAEAASVRIGVLRDGNAPKKLLAIAIREDGQTGRWFSGDGVHPLVPGDAPAGAATAVLGHR